MQGQLCNIDWLLMAKIFSPLLVLILAAVILLIKDAIPSDSDEEAGDSFALVILSAALLAAFSLSWMMWPTADDLVFGPFSVGKSCLAIWMIIFIVTGISALTALPSKVAIRREADSYFAFILIAAASYCLAVSSNDILMIFVSMEIAGVSSYATVAARSDNSYSLEGALKYFISAAFAAAFFMMGMAFIFGSVASLALGEIEANSKFITDPSTKSFFMFGAAMAVSYFGFKIAAFPFHAWMPDAVEGAPVPGASFITTVGKMVPVIILAKLAIAISPSYDPVWHHLLFGISAATMIFGAVVALRQENLKRMLAYASISQGGYMLAVIPSMVFDPAAAMKGMVFYAAAFGIATAGAFAAVAALLPGSDVTADIGRLSGSSQRSPFLSASFAILLFSLAGIPMTVGFAGRYYLFRTILTGGDILLGFVAAVVSVISIAFYVKPVMAIYFTKQEGDIRSDGEAIYAGAAVISALAIALAASLLLGILPGSLLEFINASF